MLIEESSFWIVFLLTFWLLLYFCFIWKKENNCLHYHYHERVRWLPILTKCSSEINGEAREYILKYVWSFYAENN